MPNKVYEQQIIAIVKLIPSGRVATYGQVADLAGLPRRARLVGTVLKNATHKCLPWHRVIRACGTIAFGDGSPQASEQRQRLLSEGIKINGSKIAIKNHQWQPDMYTLLYLIHT